MRCHKQFFSLSALLLHDNLSFHPMQVSALLYFGYMSVAALIFFLLTGTIGFYSCYIFVWKVIPAFLFRCLVV